MDHQSRTPSPRIGRRGFWPTVLASLLGVSEYGVVAGASEPAAGRQAMADAWWTGPLLAASASTLPQGHFLVEPYIYDVITWNTASRATGY